MGEKLKFQVDLSINTAKKCLHGKCRENLYHGINNLVKVPWWLQNITCGDAHQTSIKACHNTGISTVYNNWIKLSCEPI